jgi:2-C-methyl-D-erythritol 4-phosphate cytidylyltransferase
MSRNVAVILAGGVGNRLGLNYPKQFAKVAGKTLIEHTIEAFQNHPDIDDIIVVSKAEYTLKVLQMVDKNGYAKVTKVVNGGEKRTDSTKAALDALADEDGAAKVVIHDAVRPFISDTIIDSCLAKLDEVGAVDVVIASADTLVKVNEDDIITDIPTRAMMRRGQTPQAFRLDVIRRAYDALEKKPDITATCDCGIVLQTLPEEQVAIAEGHISNIKVTDPVDLFLCDKLFQMRGDEAVTRTARENLDLLLKGKVLVIFGGSYGIGESIADIARAAGAKVYPFARSTTGTDVTDAEAVAAALARVNGEEGRIDYVVNTAAILIRKSLKLMTQEEIDQIISINLNGAINVTMKSYQYLKRSKGSLLLYTSSSYTRGREFYSLYSATKCAIVNFTQAIAEEWLDDGIDVNCINPERTATPMRTKNFGVEPAHTLLSAEEVARASLATLVTSTTGAIIDVRIPDDEKASQIQQEIESLEQQSR